jgi:hypothetical protein
MAIWGSFTSADPTGQEYVPCQNKRSKKNVLGCQTTADNLGIAFRQKHNVNSHPVAAGGRLPGPLPLQLEPNVQPGEPWDINPVTVEDWDAAMAYDGATTGNLPGKRFVQQLDTYKSVGNVFKHSSRVARFPSDRKVANYERGASIVPSDTYAATTWPTNATGTLAFPTTPSVLTITNTALKTLVATGLVPADATKTMGTSRGTAAPSPTCTMHMQVSVQASGHPIYVLITLLGPGFRGNFSILRLSGQ